MIDRSPGREPRRAADRADDVFLRLVVDALGGVEAKAIEMKFLDPIAAVGDEKLADRAGILPIEIDGIAPIVAAPVGGGNRPNKDRR